MDILDNPHIIRIIASNENWIEGEAVRQLENTAKLSGMKRAIGLPDLHPGKGAPVGAAFFSEGRLYPHLVGNDVGCGMGLWQTELKQNKLKRDRWVKKLHGLESSWEGDTNAWLSQDNIESGEWDNALGTIGGGNHFAELQVIESIIDGDQFNNAGLSQGKLFLLVHSGSRGLGEALLRQHVAECKADGLKEGTPAANDYLAGHEHAIRWARSNRALIAHRFCSQLGTSGTRVLDVSHNSVTRSTINGDSGWLHRKGAAPSDEGLVVIPGSRGSFSYLVVPAGPQEGNGFSLAHGAGRKWKRSESKGRLKNRYTCESLSQTRFGSKVICHNKSLIYEEAPEAYKNIDVVVNDLRDAGLLNVVAILKPLITYKTRAV